MNATVNPSSFVSQYVRLVSADPGKREAVLIQLRNGKYFAENGFGVVVLIDISGYSKLTSALAAYGKVSSEVVTIAVKSFLNRIIEIVVRYGGDVVRFLGDALLVVFRNFNSDSDSNVEVLISTIRCCLDVMINHSNHTVAISSLSHVVPTSNQYTSQNVKRNESESKKLARKNSRGGLRVQEQTSEPNAEMDLCLRLHVAAVAGSLGDYIFGSDLRMDHVVYGECFEMLDSLLSDAKQDEIAISDSIMKSLANYGLNIFGSGLSGGRIVEKGVVISNEQFSALFHELSNGPDLPTSTAYEDIEFQAASDDSDQRNFVERFVNASIVSQHLKASKTLERAESKRRWDDTDSQFREITVIFVKLLDSFRPLVAHNSMQIFLNALQASEGVFQQYAGEVVNQAARLLGVASEKYPIVCTAATASRDASFEKTCLGNFKLKGNEKDVEVWSVGSKKISGMGHVPSINEPNKVFGYVEERARIQDDIQRWENEDELRTILVEGPSGIGKSTLLEHFQNLVSHINVERVCTSRMVEDLQFVPYSGIQNAVSFVFREAFEDSKFLLGRETSSRDWISTRSRTSISISGGDDVEVYACLSAFLELHNVDVKYMPLLSVFFRFSKIPENEFSKCLSLEARNLAIINVTSMILAEWTKRKRSVFVFDDIQWLDSISIAILQQVLTKQTRMLLFMCSRPVADAKSLELQNFVAGLHGLHLKLQGLNKADVKEYLLDRYRSKGAIGVDDTVVSVICKKTSMSPLILQMLFDIILKQESLQVSSEGIVSPVKSFSKSDFEHFVEHSVNNAVIIQFDQ
ncbi:hypothetical protein HDU97_005556 [Phlyctochytrium planicorne]|nr:hypothetical protein HDU97_005556 [Phlyctochytrium planicorne]